MIQLKPRRHIIVRGTVRHGRAAEARCLIAMSLLDVHADTEPLKTHTCEKDVTVTEELIHLRIGTESWKGAMRIEVIRPKATVGNAREARRVVDEIIRVVRPGGVPATIQTAGVAVYTRAAARAVSLVQTNVDLLNSTSRTNTLSIT